MKEIYNEFIEERLSCSECGKSCFDKTKKGCENCEHSEFYDLDEDTIQHCLKCAINKGYNVALEEVEKMIDYFRHIKFKDDDTTMLLELKFDIQKLQKKKEQ